MNKFAIYSPTQGQREDYPVILLSNAVTSENSNAQEWDGEIRSAKLRKPELLMGVYATSDITGADVTIKKVVDNEEVSGDYTALFTAGKTFTLYDSDGTYNQFTVDSSAFVVADTVVTATVPIFGPELIVNGDFANWADPNVPDDWSVQYINVGSPVGLLTDAGNACHWSIGTSRTVRIWQDALVLGKTYRYSFTIQNLVSGGLRLYAGGVTGETLETALSDGTYSGTFTHTAESFTDTAKFMISDTTNDFVSLDLSDVSLQEIPPFSYLFLDANVTSNDPANKDFRKVHAPDDNGFIRYAKFTSTDQTERLVGFTSDNIYYWNTVLTEWININPTTPAGLTADTEYWDCDIYGDYLVATNNQDLPIQWDGDISGTFEYMDTQLSSDASNYISKAKYIRSYRNYVILGHVTYNIGSVIFPSSIATSNVGEGVAADGFRQDAGKDAGTYLISGNGDISGGFGEWQGYLCIFKRESQRKVWYVGGAIPFNQDELNPAVGCVAPGSVVNDKDGNLFYYGTDKNFREVSYGNVSKALVKTTRDLNPELLGLMRSTYIAEYDELQWAVAYGNTSTANNKILVLNEGKWEERDIPVTAFGQYTRQTTSTWDTLPFATWNDWGWDSWDAADANTDFPVDLCGDAAGNTYELHGAYTDDGQPYESFFVVSTDMTGKQSLNHYKRMLQMYFYFKSNGAASGETAQISIKRDTEQSFQSLGSVSLDGLSDTIRVRLAVDVRARNFELKIGALNKYNFIGVEFEYVPVGDR